MTIDRAQHMLRAQAGWGGFYHGNPASLILSGLQREPGQDVVGQRIRKLELDQVSGFGSAARFEGGLAMGNGQ